MFKTALRVVGFCAALALLNGMPARAQDAFPDSIHNVLRTAALHEWTLRVTSDSGAPVTARVVDMTPSILSLVGTRIAISDIREIERRTSSGNGALTGGLILGVPLALLGWSVAGFDQASVPTTQHMEGAAVGGTIGGTLGALIGGSIAHKNYKWQVLWRSR